MRSTLVTTLRCPRIPHPNPLVTCASQQNAVIHDQHLLTAFWRSRGVQSEQHIAYLVELGVQASQGEHTAAHIAHCASTAAVDDPAPELPGANAYWQCQGSSEAAAQVGAVSQRLLKLQAVLGGHDSGIDLAWMIIREPKLVSADVDEVTRRLLEMKLATSGQGVDVIALIQEQPALLLERSGQADAGALQAAVAAWQHGVASDSMDDWDRQAGSLQQYAAVHGDAHVGARDGDDPVLVRWAAKQRADYAVGSLSDARAQALVNIGFDFDAERAEWQRWLNELQRQQGSEAPPLASGTAIQLTNWCSVQRIARRSGVLDSRRVAALDAAGFDWTGADALS